MGVDDPSDFKRQYDRAVERMETEMEHERDQQALRNYVYEKEGNLAKSTLSKRIGRFILLSNSAEEPILDMNYGKLVRFMSDISDQKDWSKGTRGNYEKTLKLILKEDGQREKSERITKTRPKSESIDEESIPNGEQLREIIEDHSRMERDRAMFMMLYELGCRLSALLSLRIKDIEIGEGIGGSTLVRFRESEGLKGMENNNRIIKQSQTFLEIYLSKEHPDPQNPEAPLFCRTGKKYKEDEDNSLSPPVVRRRLRRLLEGTELEDEGITPHSFRHARVTQMKREGYSDEEVKHQMGWSRNTDQLKRYEHIEEEEMNQKIAERMGLEVEEESYTPELENCPQCGAKIDDYLSWTQCPRCRSNLELSNRPEWFIRYLDFIDEEPEEDELFRYMLKNPYEMVDEYKDLRSKLKDIVELKVAYYSEVRGKMIEHDRIKDKSRNLKEGWLDARNERQKKMSKQEYLREMIEKDQDLQRIRREL